eukprot:7003332-Lingulodinium_polyedra.AAC.1
MQRSLPETQTQERRALQKYVQSAIGPWIFAMGADAIKRQHCMLKTLQNQCEQKTVKAQKP